MNILGYGRGKSYIEKGDNDNIEYDYARFGDYGGSVLYCLGNQWMCGKCWQKDDYYAVQQWIKNKDKTAKNTAK